MMRVGLETAMQMDRGGCSQTRGNARSILQRKAYVSCQGYVGILKSARFLNAKQGGTADKVVYSPLTERVSFGQGRFVFVRMYKFACKNQRKK